MQISRRFGDDLFLRRSVLCWLVGCGLCVLGACLSACAGPTAVLNLAPTPTLQIRHRDALPLMLDSADLGAGYKAVEVHRLERGKGWGDDTTRLSGYRMVFEGGVGVFSRIVCQVECYLSVEDAQSAYRAYREDLAGDLRASAAYESVSDSEERLLGDWNRLYTARSRDSVTLDYIFLRENVLVDLSLAGPDAPDFPVQADRQARLLDERIFQR
jgi:hypothetical protein